MEKTGRRHRWLKALLWALAVIVVLPALLVGSLQCALQSRLPVKVVDKIAAKYLDADLSVGKLNASLLKFPTVTLSLENVAVCYPHDRFAAYDSTTLYNEGRSLEGDTLAVLGSLNGRINVMPLLEGKIRIREASVEGLRLYARQYDSTVCNWDVLRLPPKDESDTTGSELNLAIRSVSIGGGTKAVFGSLPIGIDSLDVPLELFCGLMLKSNEESTKIGVRRLEAQLMGVPLQSDAWVTFLPEETKMTGNLYIKELPLGDLAAAYGPLFAPQIAAIRTDARLDLSIDADGSLKRDANGWQFPQFTAFLNIPEASLGYADLIKDGKVKFGVHAVNDKALDLTLSDLALNFDGLKMKADGSVKDMLGRDPIAKCNANMDLVLGKLVRLLPKSLKGLTAAGNVHMDLKGSGIRLSNLSMAGMLASDLDANLKSDALRVSMPSASLLANLDKTDIHLQTMESLSEPGKRTFGAKAGIDSLNFEAGAIFAKGRSLELFAQNDFTVIDTSSHLPPLVAKVKAQRLSMRNTDSLVVAVSNTSNTLSITPVEENGTKVPRVLLESDNERVIFRNDEMLAFASGVDLAANAKMRASRNRSARPARRDSTVNFAERRAALDTALIPDFMSEKDFKASDISVALDASIKNTLRRWNPSGKVMVEKGMIVSKTFPLRTRVSGFGGRFNMDEIDVDSLRMVAGQSDVSAKGKLSGLRPVLLGRGTPTFDLKLDMKSDNLNVNELLAAFSKADKDSEEDVEQLAVDSIDNIPDSAYTYSLIVVPGNLVADLSLDAKNVQYAMVTADTLSLKADMKERCLRITDASAATDYGNFNLDAFYSTKTKKDISCGFNLSLGDVSAEKVIALFPVLDDVVPMLKTFKGDLDCEFTTTALLDTNMNILVPSLNGVAKINGRDLIVEDIGSLKRITKLLMFKDKASGNITDLSVSAVVADNQLEVFPFVLGVDRYTLALNGCQNFSTGFNYHASIIKSPLPVKIGVNVFGPDFDNWKFRLGKPRYPSTKVPVYTEQIDNLKINLAQSIRNIFAKGVDQALEQSREASALIERKRRAEGEDTSSEMLSYEDQMKLEAALIEEQIEEETRALNEEIDRLLAEL